MFGFGALIFTFRDTSVVLMYCLPAPDATMSSKINKQPLATLALTTVVQKPKL
jgi:hypothetical protein